MVATGNLRHIGVIKLAGVEINEPDPSIDPLIAFIAIYWFQSTTPVFLNSRNKNIDLNNLLILLFIDLFSFHE